MARENSPPVGGGRRGARFWGGVQIQAAWLVFKGAFFCHTKGMSNRSKAGMGFSDGGDAGASDEALEAEALSLTLVEEVMPPSTPSMPYDVACESSDMTCESSDAACVPSDMVCETPDWNEIEASVPAGKHTSHPAHKYNHCGVCNSELGFTHLTHFEYNTVIEEAFCYVCQNKAKKQNHSLQ